MKNIILVALSLFGFFAIADSSIARPNDRYVYIGDFEPGAPFNWDEDTIISPVREWTQGIVFDIRQGIDVEVRDITIVCSRGRVCDRIQGGTLTERRPVYVPFRRDLDVSHVIVRSKPRGFSVPPTRVDVYLEYARGF